MNTSTKKQFLRVNGKEILQWTLEAVCKNKHIDELILIVSEDEVKSVRDKVGIWLPEIEVKLVIGGQTRDDSVLKGLTACDQDSSIVFIHDGVRPYVQSSWIDDMLEALISSNFSGIALGKPLTDTIKKVLENGEIVGHVDRSDLWRIETPQMFYYQEILEAHQKKSDILEEITDDAQLMTVLGKRIKILAYEGINDKLTRPEELELAKLLLK